MINEIPVARSCDASPNDEELQDSGLYIERFYNKQDIYVRFLARKISSRFYQPSSLDLPLLKAFGPSVQSVEPHPLPTTQGLSTLSVFSSQMESDFCFHSALVSGWEQIVSVHTGVVAYQTAGKPYVASA